MKNDKMSLKNNKKNAQQNRSCQAFSKSVAYMMENKKVAYQSTLVNIIV